MNTDNLTENIETILEAAKAIEYELENNSGEHAEAVQLYETLEGNGVTTDADEIVAAVELTAELSSDDAAEINSALELWESVNGNGHDTEDIEAALEVYAIVEDSHVQRSDLEGMLELATEWDQHCSHTWADPESIARDCTELGEIVALLSSAFGQPIHRVDEAKEAIIALGGGNVSDKEQALLDAIKAFCEPA